MIVPGDFADFARLWSKTAALEARWRVSGAGPVPDYPRLDLLRRAAIVLASACFGLSLRLGRRSLFPRVRELSSVTPRAPVSLVFVVRGVVVGWFLLLARTDLLQRAFQMMFHYRLRR